MPAYHVHITGRVQGVGFRPYIYNLARDYAVKGWVRNDINGLEIEYEADQADADRFYQQLIHQPPTLSIIKSFTRLRIPDRGFADFHIKDSSDKGEVGAHLSPDFGLCDACRQELHDNHNRRYRYAFITCTKCGPRYSIQKNLPYDREHTTMAPYVMCDECTHEYKAIDNRRYYSQTNSCGDCPILMTMWSKSGQLAFNQDEIIYRIREAVFEEKKIVAVKGIGGYLLLADATDEHVVKTLRERKRRNKKPFALMYPDMATMRADLIVGPDEELMLCSEKSPILLLKMKNQMVTGVKAHLIAPELDSLGAMLPYTGVFELILSGKKTPVIGTSANISGAPILFEDDRALEELWFVADYVVTHDRKIVIPQDDSVMRFTSGGNDPIILRRSRGLAPCFMESDSYISASSSIVAFGAELKASFSIAHNGQIYSSQYLGQLGTYDCEVSYIHTLGHMIRTLHCQPEVVLADSHPDYCATRLGYEMAWEHKIEFHKIQHHKAHFAAVLAENGLLETDDRILGVIWDGMGYGEDGQVWGGEFFTYDGTEIHRVSHIEYYDHLSGDRMSAQPRLSLLSLLIDTSLVQCHHKAKYSDQELALYGQMMQSHQLMKTSSMGRVIDAVASLLGLCDVNDYEGHAAILLEQAAQRYVTRYGVPEPYDIKISDNGLWDVRQLIREIDVDYRRGVDTDCLAARFHRTLVQIIEDTAHYFGMKSVAFSGGVFQNALLVDMLKQQLTNSFQLYFHRELSPNDENISFGQLAYYNGIMNKKKMKRADLEYVVN